MKPGIVCFGEVLWDVLPTGAVPGGAPMNVAYHLNKLGKTPALITRVGDDEQGRELLAMFSRYGLTTDYFQVDKEHETGKVFARPGANHEMTYDIVKPVAWDFIGYSDHVSRLVKEAGYFVFGSLAARSETSRETLLRLLADANRKVLDINLRAPHYDRPLLEVLMERCDILKLNESELAHISGWFNDYKVVNEQIRTVSDRYSISTIIVTLAEKGAVLFANDQLITQQGLPVTVADTVGSGDAFLAGLLSRFIENKGGKEALAFACTLGAFVATKKGACPDYDVSELADLSRDIQRL